MSQRIGFVDFDLNNFHADVYLKLLRGDLRARGFTVAGATALQAESSQAWCAQNGVPYYSDVDALDAHVDCYAVLAPSNPEVHESLCQRVFPCGKPTYVDKTFAPDLAAAERMFALADQHGVAMQTSSALRYSNVQERLAEIEDDLLHIITWGGGSSFGEYAIHPLELAFSCMGPDVQRLHRRGAGEYAQLLLDFSNNRTAVVNVYTNTSTPFAAMLTTTNNTEYIAVDSSTIFRNTTEAMLDLFESGTETINRRETLAIHSTLDAAKTDAACAGPVDL